MIRGLVISAMFALGIAVGCSQQDRTTATVVPNTASPAVADTKTTNDPVLPEPTVVDATATNDPVLPEPIVVESAPTTDSDATAGPPSPRQVPPRFRGFVPLDDPTFLAAHETEYFGDEELVVGVEFAGQVRAYTVRMLRYHHVVNDTVGSEPLLVTS